MWERIKNDRRFQFAIGLAVVLVAVKWLFTGTPLFAIGDLQAAPAEGQTKAGATVSALLPVVVDVAVGALVAVGAWVVNLAGMIFSQVSGSKSDSSPAVDVAVNSADKTRQAVIDFARAAAKNDREAMESLRVQLRRPEAIAEYRDACEAGDVEAVSRLNEELAKMIGGGVATTKKRGAAANG